MTGFENLGIYAAIYGLPKAVAHARIKELMLVFGLEERIHDRVAGFSKGMKQTLALSGRTCPPT